MVSARKITPSIRLQQPPMRMRMTTLVTTLALMLALVALLGMPSVVDSLVTPASHRSTVYGSTMNTRTSTRATRAASFRSATAGSRSISSSGSSPGSRTVSVSISMRDRSSSYWFSVGDTVRVVEDVVCGSSSSGSSSPTSSTSTSTTTTTTTTTNLRGRIGTVVETWEKCDVDPTCCCAEQVDTDMAVRVVFGKKDKDNDDDNDKDNGIDNDNDDDKNETRSTTESESPFYYYFAEEELVRVDAA
eukprot:jgi/Psemu1/39767/gm1.39767_g